MNDNELEDPDTNGQGTAGPGEMDDSTAKDDAVEEAGEIESLRLENADLRNRLLREMAEMENLRKRTSREKADASRFAIAKFARDLLTVGDDLRRAIDAAAADPQIQTDAPVKTLLSGIEATERQLLGIFDRHGVRRFEPLGEKFDPTNHEALFELPDPSTPNGTIMQVVEAGYTIGDRVLRPARVGVAKGGPRIAPQSAADETPAKAEADAGNNPEATSEPQQPADTQSKASEPPSQPTEPSSGENDGGVGGRVDRTA